MKKTAKRAKGTSGGKPTRKARSGLMGGPSATGAIVLGSAGGCQTSATPWLLCQRGGEVIWLLQNRCPNGRRIKIRFVGVNPLTSSTHEMPVPGGGGMNQIVRQVKEKIADGVYKYSVHGGDTVLDPELEVRGPLAPRPRKKRTAKAKGARAKGTRRRKG
jgi:hypothetical protein